jgi:enamine deaminase RidA (YjgF/YER057c/UK114 family)
MGRENISSGSPWEPKLGYSRAVKVGSMVFVAGTTGTGEDGELVGPGDAGAQTTSAADVVRTTLYVTDISKWEEIGTAHGEIFGEIRPAMAMVEVSSLIDPEMLVEISADAVIAG